MGTKWEQTMFILFFVSFSSFPHPFSPAFLALLTLAHVAGTERKRAFPWHHSPPPVDAARWRAV
jgi:hypothetical protein